MKPDQFYTAGPTLCAAVRGFSLHAATAIAAEDRAGLERLCRYGLRAPFSLKRFSLLPDGRVRYELRRPWPTAGGATELVLDPLSLMERLAALVPKPYANLVRYHGVFANRSRF
ncbi:transposase, partial [Myxococcota bacterium]